MNVQQLKNKNEVPPGGFRYFQKETERWVTAASWPELIVAVKKHRRANELPIGLLFEQEIETQLCSTLPPGSCGYSSSVDEQRAAMIARPTWEKFLELSRVVVGMVKGSGLASSAEANAHAATCAKCVFNQKPEGCTSCNLSGLVDVLAKMGGAKTSYDSRLDGCVLCGCSLKAKVHVPAEILAQAAGDRLEAYPDWCWIRNGA